METLSDFIEDDDDIPMSKLKVEKVKDFIKSVLFEIDHLNEKFEAIAMRCNIETMAGDKLC